LRPLHDFGQWRSGGESLFEKECLASRSVHSVAPDKTHFSFTLTQRAIRVCVCVCGVGAFAPPLLTPLSVTWYSKAEEKEEEQAAAMDGQERQVVREHMYVHL
jgi:hypothetical protein